MSVSTKYYCSNCREPLKAEDKQCPRCECKNRDIEVTIDGKITLKGVFKIKFKPKGKKVTHITKKGWQDSKNKDKFPEGVDILMKIDRENDIYRQIIRDRKTGKIVHEEDEPLSKHKSSFKNK